jgi:hypothetical protein
MVFIGILTVKRSRLSYGKELQMRITYENGKKYRAYSPEEFFKSPERPQTLFNMDKPTPKYHGDKELHEKTPKED